MAIIHPPITVYERLNDRSFYGSQKLACRGKAPTGEGTIVEHANSNGVLKLTLTGDVL